MPPTQTPAIVIDARPLGEADLLVVLLTPTLGKVRAAAANGRKSRRRFAGGLPSGGLGEAELSPGRKHDSLFRLDHFRLRYDMSPVGRDLDRFAYVAYLCELTDALVHEPEGDPRRFVALAEAIHQAAFEPIDPGILRRYELRLLESLGLLPALDTCCICGASLQPALEEAAFDGTRGGTLCPLHDEGCPRIPSAVLVLAQNLVAADDPSGSLAELRAALVSHRRALRDLNLALVREHLRRPLRSLEFFAQLAPSSGRPLRSGAEEDS